jgi:hypothetical protein
MCIPTVAETLTDLLGSYIVSDLFVVVLDEATDPAGTVEVFSLVLLTTPLLATSAGISIVGIATVTFLAKLFMWSSIVETNGMNAGASAVFVLPFALPLIRFVSKALLSLLLIALAACRSFLFIVPAAELDVGNVAPVVATRARDAVTLALWEDRPLVSGTIDVLLALPLPLIPWRIVEDFFDSIDASRCSDDDDVVWWSWAAVNELTLLIIPNAPLYSALPVLKVLSPLVGAVKNG